MGRFLPLFVFLFALAFFFISERVDFFQADQHQPTTVSLWAFSTPAQTMMQLKSAFEDQHPDIRVDVQTVPWDNLQEKTLWAIAANSNVPDVIIGSSEWTGGLASNGALQPLDEIVEPGLLKRYFPSTLGIYQFPEVRRDKPGWRGKMRQYGIPLDLDLMMIFYRADKLDPILAELGMKEFPESWADFLRLGEAVRDHNKSFPQREFLLYLDPEDPVPVSMAFLPSSGASFLDNRLQHAVFDSDEAVAAFEFFHDLLETKSAIRWERSTMADPLVLYKQDRTFANIAGPWYGKFLESKAPEQAGRWHVALFPTRKPGLPTSGLGGACIAMPYNAPHKKAAAKLIKFMAEDKFAMAYFDRVGSPPPQKTAWESPVFSAEYPYFGGQHVYEVVRKAIETARPLQLMPSAEIVKGPVRSALRKIAITRVDAESVLREAASRANKILKQEM